MIVWIALFSGQVASFILFQPLREAVLASTSLGGMAVLALIPFQMIVAFTICPPGMVALSLMTLLGVVVLALATTAWVPASESMAFFATVPSTTRPFGMVMVALALKNAVLA